MAKILRRTGQEGCLSKLRSMFKLHDKETYFQLLVVLTLSHIQILDYSDAFLRSPIVDICMIATWIGVIHFMPRPNILRQQIVSGIPGLFMFLLMGFSFELLSVHCLKIFGWPALAPNHFAGVIRPAIGTMYSLVDASMAYLITYGLRQSTKVLVKVWSK